MKKVIDRMAAGDAGDYSYELDKMIADSRLSQEFQGISEVSIILKLLLEKIMDKSKFDNVAVRVCTIFRGTLNNYSRILILQTFKGKENWFKKSGVSRN